VLAHPADYAGPGDVSVAQEVVLDRSQLRLAVSWGSSFTAAEGQRWVAVHRGMAAALHARLAQLGVPVSGRG
jgi:hypothetical protein